MEHIIQEIVAKYIENVLGVLRESGLASIGQAAQQLHSLSKDLTLEILGASIEQMDMALVAASRERREDGLRIKERDVPRTILTELGELRYTRTYFEDKTGERCYLLDHLIGVSPYERLSPELCAALVQKAAETSMEKVARQLAVPVSRQTVNNKVLALNEVCIDAVPAKETPSELHLFADEDHVHMKDGRNAIVPLVTVTEGIDNGKKRHTTISPVHFEGYGMDTQDLFEGISSFLYARYDMDRVNRIYVHADGGKWIAAARDWLPNVQFVMDGFHLEKHLRQLSRLPGADSRMPTIRRAIRENAFACFVEQCTRIDENLDEATHDTLTKTVNFIQNHRDAIALRLQNSVCGSCTESLVSHILSERLSRDPLAWSVHGLRQMAMLRVYVKNGGVVTANDVRVYRSRAALEADAKSHSSGYAKYRRLADKQIHDFLSTRCDWSLFEPSPLHSGKLDAVGMLKKAYGSLRDNLAAS